MYVNGIFAKNMSKNHIFPICDALAQKVLITRKLVFSFQGVQGGSETSNVVRVGDSGTDEKTGGGDGGGRVEDVAIFIRSDKNGQDQE